MLIITVVIFDGPLLEQTNQGLYLSFLNRLKVKLQSKVKDNCGNPSLLLLASYSFLKSRS